MGQTTTNANGPERTIRIGAVEASIFLNSTKEGRTFRNVQIRRRYRDGEQWKLSSSFTLNDLPVLLQVAKLALDWVAQNEATRV